MIDNAKTLLQFGYLASSLKPKSSKRVVAVCDACQAERVVCFAGAGTFCKHCAAKQPEHRRKNSAALRSVWRTTRKGWKHSEETKQRVSKSKMGTPAWNKGLRGVFKPTQEHMGKLRAALRAKGRDEQHCKRISNSLKGNTNSKGKKWQMSEQGKANIRAANGHRGKPAWNRGKSNHWCKGEKNVAWAGGVSKRGYPSEFNAALKLRIRERDNFTMSAMWAHRKGRKSRTEPSLVRESH